MPKTAAEARAAATRAGDGARTRDIKLGRLALYQLSYSRVYAHRRPGKPTIRSNGGGRIRTFEGLRRQIYSLLPLAAWVPHPGRPVPRTAARSLRRIPCLRAADPLFTRSQS